MTVEDLTPENFDINDYDVQRIANEIMIMPINGLMGITVEIETTVDDISHPPEMIRGNIVKGMFIGNIDIEGLDIEYDLMNELTDLANSYCEELNNE